MSDRLTSWLRTVVPGLWSALVAWLVTLGLPESFATTFGGLGDVVVVPIVLAVVYAALRWIEPMLPDWLTRILLGSAVPPVYGLRDPDGSYTVTAVGRDKNGIPRGEQRPG
jgi:hypothetical protein